MGTRQPQPYQPRALRLDVARVARERGIVSRRGPKAGQPSVEALRRGAGIAYATAYELLRWPNRVSRLDLGTLERVARFYGVEPWELFTYDPAIAPCERPQPRRQPLGEATEGFIERLRAPAKVQGEHAAPHPDDPPEWTGEDDRDWSPAPSPPPAPLRPPLRPFVRPRGSPDQWSFEALVEAHARGVGPPLPNG